MKVEIQQVRRKVIDEVFIYFFDQFVGMQTVSENLLNEIISLCELP